jgi:hypothetical protein
VIHLLIIAAAMVAAGGCAMGKKYDYQVANIEIPAVGTNELGVAVVDRRAYVNGGDKQSNFVGLQRGVFGQPFEVTTTSGNPMAIDMQAALARALEEQGYEVTELDISLADDSVVGQVIKQNAAKRNVVLLLNEWKTDAMMSFGLTYDIILQIFDQNHSLLAQASAEGIKEVVSGGGMARPDSLPAAHAFEVKVSLLFNDPEIKRTLVSD